ncbi:MAG: hypothetical protein VKP70_10105 [Cyanobacteriota bacterium]|nr:hypothetical protein [Cyanobacteriota bacterium]
MSSTLSRPTLAPAPFPASAWRERPVQDEPALETTVVRYNAGHGPNSHVTLRWGRHLQPKDATTRVVRPLAKPMGLTLEELRGSKVERQICLPPINHTNLIIAGGVIDSLKLLSTGRFHYLQPAERRPYSIHITADPVRGWGRNQPQGPAITIGAGGAITPSATMAEMEALRTWEGNSEGLPIPSRSSSAEMVWSTFSEGLDLHMGGSSFPMGSSSARPFAFSAEKYRYAYVYRFEQIFFSASADGPLPGAATLFHGGIKPPETALFIQKVTYGKRLYVIVESEYPLETLGNHFGGSLEWIVLSAKLQRDSIASQARNHLSIRLLSQDGWTQVISDCTTLERAVDQYFQPPCSRPNLWPLSYHVCDLQGAPVSLVTTACLDGQQCLTSPKARVHLKSISFRAPSPRTTKATKRAGTGPLELHGNVQLRVAQERGRPSHGQGLSMAGPDNPEPIPAGTITVARKEAPLKLREGQAMTLGANEPTHYIDVAITSLDMSFEIEPFISRSPHLNAERWISTNSHKQTLRQMLLEGSMETTFHFQNGNDLLDLTIDIKPL